MATVITILNALAAIPKIAGYIETLCSAIVLWYVQRQTNETLAEISNAADLAASATTDTERFAAAAAWQKALSTPRVTSS